MWHAAAKRHQNSSTLKNIISNKHEIQKYKNCEEEVLEWWSKACNSLSSNGHSLKFATDVAFTTPSDTSSNHTEKASVISSSKCLPCMPRS